LHDELAAFHAEFHNFLAGRNTVSGLAYLGADAPQARLLIMALLPCSTMTLLQALGHYDG
jgi:hypothetical protein